MINEKANIYSYINSIDNQLKDLDFKLIRPLAEKNEDRIQQINFEKQKLREKRFSLIKDLEVLNE